jgi:hypothetical protein
LAPFVGVVSESVAKLTTEQRNTLPDSDFAIPETRSYPIMDRAHAVDALARVSGNGTQEEKRRVAMAVHRRYPDLRAKLRGVADG